MDASPRRHRPNRVNLSGLCVHPMRMTWRRRGAGTLAPMVNVRPQHHDGQGEHTTGGDHDGVELDAAQLAGPLTAAITRISADLARPRAAADVVPDDGAAAAVSSP
jgi:hypothetical protein